MRRRCDLPEGPGPFRRFAGVEDRSRSLVVGENDFDVSEGAGEAITGGLEICFQVQMRRKPSSRRSTGRLRRVATSRDEKKASAMASASGTGRRASAFDADAPPPSAGEESQAAGVRGVEAQFLKAGTLRQLGLPIRAMAEYDALWTVIQVAGGDQAKDATPHEKLVPIARKSESIRAFPLFL
jgi:hypothetical protein